MFKKVKTTAVASLVATIMTLGLMSYANVGIVSNAIASDGFESSWAAADEQRKMAAKLGFEWRDTKKLLKKAKAANESGENEKAMKLVAKAHEQSNDAIAQQERESSAWQSRVPK
ncbi:MAG: hypothetical protein GKR96_08905 [Gammaproteobacteria bacterium]|nr:hypothetical protein [Gammaproteobacteria bacterium]